MLIRRAEVVSVHLNTLEELLDVSKPSVAEALRASLSLRFSFDGALNQAAHLLGQTIEIPAPVLEGIPIEEAVLFACGGYQLGAATVRPHYTYREPGTTTVGTVRNLKVRLPILLARTFSQTSNCRSSCYSLAWGSLALPSRATRRSVMWPTSAAAHTTTTTLPSSTSWTPRALPSWRAT